MPAHIVNHLRIPGGVPKPEGLDELERLEATFEPVRSEVARDTTRARRFECLATKRRLAARRWRHVQRYADAKAGVIERTCHERARPCAATSARRTRAAAASCSSRWPTACSPGSRRRCRPRPSARCAGSASHRYSAAPSSTSTTPASRSRPRTARTTAGMVAVVNSVVVAACAGLVLEAAGVHSLAIPVAVGAVIGAAAFTLHERHHRRARDAYSPEAVDRAAIFVLPSQPADAA
jgi:hypothetical protein